MTAFQAVDRGSIPRVRTSKNHPSGCFLVGGHEKANFFAFVEIEPPERCFLGVLSLSKDEQKTARRVPRRLVDFDPELVEGEEIYLATVRIIPRVRTISLLRRKLRMQGGQKKKSWVVAT